MEKVSKATSFSTILIGIYMVLLSCVEIAAVLFCKIAGDATMTGVDITAMVRESDDYISGYLIVPRILGTVFSGMAEITVLILAAVLFIVLLIFLAVLIISCILIKKRKLKADAWMKIIIFSILTGMSAFLIQSSVLAVLMAVPVVLGAWIVWVLAVITFLIGLQYLREALERQQLLGAMEESDVRSLLTRRVKGARSRIALSAAAVSASISSALAASLAQYDAEHASEETEDEEDAK